MTPASASATVAERVRDRVRAEGFDPAAESDRAATIARAELRRHNDFALARGIPTIDDEASCLREVLASLAGFGPLQPYLDDPSVEGIRPMYRGPRLTRAEVDGATVEDGPRAA